MIFSQMVLFVIQGVKFKHFYGHLQISALEPCIGIGIGIRTDTTNAIIFGSIRSMDTKPSRVMIQDQGTLPTKSRDTSISWSRGK